MEAWVAGTLVDIHRAVITSVTRIAVTSVAIDQVVAATVTALAGVRSGTGTRVGGAGALVLFNIAVGTCVSVITATSVNICSIDTSTMVSTWI